MRTTLHLTYDHPTPLPERFGDDVRMPPVLARRLVSEFAAHGDRVLDPFAGFGTTLAVAERLDRKAWGVEYDRDRAAYARDHLEHPERLLHGTATDIPDRVPTVDCIVTSPPYMHESDTRDPLQDYAGESDYETYLETLGDVFAALGSRLHRDGRLVLEAANLKHAGRTTTFAWDLVDTIRGLPGFRFAGEHVVSWDGEDSADGVYGYGYDHSYVLVFEYEVD